MRLRGRGGGGDLLRYVSCKSQSIYIPKCEMFDLRYFLVPEIEVCSFLSQLLLVVLLLLLWRRGGGGGPPERVIAGGGGGDDGGDDVFVDCGEGEAE